MIDSEAPASRWPLAPALVAAVLFAYFGAWALLRPPLQSPDEPQHLLKASSVLRQPWVGPPGRFELEAAHVNPLALDTPPSLDKLFFRPFNAMTAADIVNAKSVDWLDRHRALPAYERAIASYPTPYYLLLFGVAEPMTAALGLSPYQATYAYRLVSAALAAVLWALVWVVLVRMPEIDTFAVSIFALVVLNPMLAFMSSAVNPDAVNNPLCALALLLVWRVSTTGRGRVAAMVSLLGAMLTKPAGLQLVPALGAVIGALTATRRLAPRRAAMTIGLTVGAAMAAVVAFYAWSPPQFMAGGPSEDRFSEFLAYRWTHAGLAWRMYWGQLGWLDYTAPAVWHRLVALMVLVNLACLMLRPRPNSTLGWYLGLAWVAFTLVTFAGEYWYLPTAGYTFQGRYLLPAALGAGALFCHSVPLARHGLLASVAALNLVLAHATVVRYFADQYAGLWQSLPF